MCGAAEIRDRTQERPAKQQQQSRMSLSCRVPEAGLEPARPEGRGILSPLRLPIPPLGRGPQSSPSGARRSTLRRSAAVGRRRRAAAPGTIGLSHFLEPLVQPLLERQVLRALHRREKTRKLLLLRLEQVGALALRLHELADVLVDLVLIADPPSPASPPRARRASASRSDSAARRCRSNR